MDGRNGKRRADMSEKVDRKASKRQRRDEDDIKMTFETSENVDAIASFDGMGIQEDILQGVYAYGK